MGVYDRESRPRQNKIVIFVLKITMVGCIANEEETFYCCNCEWIGHCLNTLSNSKDDFDDNYCPKCGSSRIYNIT